MAGGTAEVLFEAFPAPAVPPRLARAVTATADPPYTSQKGFNLLKRRSRNHLEDSVHLYYGLLGLIPGGGGMRAGRAGRHRWAA